MSLKVSDYSDEFSDGGSSMMCSEEPPTLNETIFDISLFSLFQNYMNSQQLVGDLLFLKQARLYRFLKIQHEVVVQQAVKLIWMFFTESAPYPVTVSEEVKKKLVNMAFDPDAQLQIDLDTFSVAFEQSYNVVVPHFRNWISTNEWREAVPFHRIPPPTFDIVLGSKSLRFLFNKYLKSQLEGDEGAVHAFHLWKFCIIASDFREGKYGHSTHSDEKKKDKKSDDLPEEDPDKPVNPEEYAKRVCKKYKHHISLEYNGTFSYEVFIIRALDQAITEFDKSALFQNWLALKQYQGVDYQSMTVHQTLTPEGFAEPPTLAAAMTSSMLPFFLILLANTEEGADLEFLVDVLKYRKQYESTQESSQASTGGSTGSSSGSTRREMNEEAKRIFAKFLDSNLTYCDPRLIEEVRNVLKKGGKAVTSSVFRKCGAFVYQRAEHTWCRQARATLLWTNKSYDNRCKAARAIEEEFAPSVLPEGIDLQVVPTIDDTLTNPELFDDYCAYIKNLGIETMFTYHQAYLDYFALPVNQRKPMLEKFLGIYGQIAADFPELAGVHKVFVKECTTRERVSDTVFSYSMHTVVRALAKRYYPKWLVEHSMVWKKAKWTPVPAVTFSDLSTVFSIQDVEKKIQDEAVKGKSGLSKYLALRSAKKQTVANVRTKPAAALSDTSRTVFTTKKDSDMAYFGAQKKSDAVAAAAAAADKCDLLVPSMLETLSSPFLRNYFDTILLSTCLSATQHQLWEELQKFYTKYLEMDDEKLAESQDEMRKAIEHICDKFKNELKNAEALKERAKKAKIIFPHFFRSSEMEMYKDAHSDFEKVLQRKGWK